MIRDQLPLLVIKSRS